MNNFRVLEVIKGDGTTKFYPQRKRFFLFWKTMKDTGDNRRSFKSLERSNEFLKEFQSKTRGDKIVKTKKHSFNEVFERLKNG